ncbi:MAG: heme-dependent oxidative N-demethylase family protein [Oscillochloridaceae bacterium umkhey_bin13]
MTITSLSPFDLQSDQFSLKVGARPLEGEPLLIVEPTSYLAEVGLKELILTEDHAYYYRGLPGSEPAQWDALRLLLPTLAQTYPAHFVYTADGDQIRWHNRLTGQQLAFRLGDAANLPLAPLDWLGRQVQEDLLILAGDPDTGFPLIAGQLCFPNHWCLDEKLGLPLLAIHEPVPAYAAQIGRSTDLLMARLKPERPVWRRNWSVVVSAQLNLASRYQAEMAARKTTITAENVGERCYFRTERQTLSRLEPSGAILFTIYTQAAPIASLAADPGWAKRFLNLLHSTPEAMRTYKGITPYYPALVAYLESQAR